MRDRDKTYLWFGLMMAGYLLALAGIVVAAKKCERDERAACREAGGRVLDVKSGRGGFVCVEPAERAP